MDEGSGGWQDFVVVAVLYLLFLLDACKFVPNYFFSSEFEQVELVKCLHRESSGSDIWAAEDTTSSS